MIENIPAYFAGSISFVALVIVLLFVVNLKPFLTTREILKALSDTEDDISDVLALVKAPNASIKGIMDAVVKEQKIAENEEYMEESTLQRMKAKSTSIVREAISKK